MSVALIEREPRSGDGISSRNSGVIHAGMYYPQSSLKTKFCVEGNKLLYEYAELKKINIGESTKVIQIGNNFLILKMSKSSHISNFFEMS